MVECSSLARETRFQSQVKSYRRIKKWYLIPPCLTLSNIKYVSRVKWSNPGKEVVPSLTPQYSNYWKGSFLVALDYDRQLYNLLVSIILLRSLVSGRNWWMNLPKLSRALSDLSSIYIYIYIYIRLRLVTRIAVSMWLLYGWPTLVKEARRQLH